MGTQAGKQIGGAVIGVLLAAVIWNAPTPSGMTPLGQTILAILVLTVCAKLTYDLVTTPEDLYSLIDTGDHR